MITTYEEFVSHGIESYTAERTVEAYQKRIGEVHGDYVITDIEYDFDNHGRLVTETCKGCGGKYQKFMVNGRNKWGELKKVCPVCEEQRRLDREERKYFEHQAQKEKDKEERNQQKIQKILAREPKKRITKYGEHDVGKRYGQLTVIGISYKARCDGSRGMRYVCQCDCGNIKDIKPTNLDLGMIKSCGCMHDEWAKESSTKHGGSNDRLYHVWCGMIYRCENHNSESYKDYGGRGIAVCPEWHDYNVFKEWAYANGYDETADRGICTIDRIDVNGNYEPSNCRWVDTITQANNKRANKYITYDGETHTVTEWDRILCLNGKLNARLNRGWSIEEVFGEKERNVRRERKASPEDAKNYIVGVRLTEDLADYVDKFAVDNNINKSEAIRRMLDYGIKKFAFKP